MGIKAKGKAEGLFPVSGELNTTIIREAFRGNYSISGEYAGTIIQPSVRDVRILEYFTCSVAETFLPVVI